MKQCDDGKSNGTAGDPCESGCKLAPNCGNAKIEPGEECDLGLGNSCTAGTASKCTCTCTNPKCGDGVIQQNECCDDGGDSQLSKCTAMCTACKDPNDPECKCGA